MNNAFEQATAVEAEIMPAAVAAVETALRGEVHLIKDRTFQLHHGDGILITSVEFLSIDFKNRPKTYDNPGMLLEIYSNRSRQTLGWGINHRAQLIAEYRADSGHLTVIKSPRDWLSSGIEEAETAYGYIDKQWHTIGSFWRIGEEKYQMVKQESFIQMNDTWFIIVPSNDLINASLLVY